MALMWSCDRCEVSAKNEKGNLPKRPPQWISVRTEDASGVTSYSLCPEDSQLIQQFLNP